jgi:hypothetical protein
LDVSRERAQELAGKLGKIERMFTSLTEVQKMWLYLMPVFASEVLRGLQAGARFVEVDKKWREAMATLDAHQIVVAAIDEPSLATDALAHLEQELDQIQKGLGDYVQHRRRQFPRFYFLSEVEVYSILSEAENPLLVQPVRAKHESPLGRRDSSLSPEPATPSQLLIPALAALSEDVQ